MSAPDTGWSTASIVASGDDRSWPHIERELQAGAILLRVAKLKRSYCDKGQGPYGPGISDARVRKLEKAGTLKHVGVDRYALANAPDGR